MNAFFDTSALLKRYIVEPGFEKVNEIFGRANDISVSVISQVEVMSAFARILGESGISVRQFGVLERAFGSDSASFVYVAVDDEVVKIAKGMVFEYKLRTLDSLQLASAIVAEDVDIFVCADKRLLSAAFAYGLKVVDPTSAV